MRVIVAVWKTHSPARGKWGGAWYVRSVEDERNPTNLDIRWTINSDEAYGFEDKVLLDLCLTVLTGYDTLHHAFSVREL
jgi:hypothetical protein